MIEIMNDSKLLAEWYKIYFAPSNQKNLLGLIEVFKLLNPALIKDIKNTKGLISGLNFDRKKILKLYDKQKNRLQRNKI